MISEEVLVKSIKHSLRALKGRIEILVPTALCHIAETVGHDARQIYASFLKTPQDDTLDLCILLRSVGTTRVVSGDLVKGGSGDVLSEIGPMTFSEYEEKTEPFEQHICQYILEQEDPLVQALRAETGTTT